MNFKLFYKNKQVNYVVILSYVFLTQLPFMIKMFNQRGINDIIKFTVNLSFSIDLSNID